MGKQKMYISGQNQTHFAAYECPFLPRLGFNFTKAAQIFKNLNYISQFHRNQWLLCVSH